MTRWWRSSLDGASAATKHYVERTLLGYRLAGVDKDEATRDRLHALHDKATQLSLEFSRNIQEGGKTIEAAPEELEGLPADYIARHPAQKGEDGAERVTLTTDPPDMMPVMTFAASAELRETDVSGVQHARVSREPANSARSAGDAAGDCERAGLPQLGRSGDGGPDDEVGGECAGVSGQSSMRPAAKARSDEHEQVLEFARQRQPELAEIDITSRGYWYEQFRRTRYDFDSQSVRPYFPYARVEAGVLETAAKLFKVEFRPSTAPAWHEAVSVYEVFEDGRMVGRFYLDMHPREGKSKWFSAAPVVTGVRGACCRRRR